MTVEQQQFALSLAGWGIRLNKRATIEAGPVNIYGEILSVNVSTQQQSTLAGPEVVGVNAITVRHADGDYTSTFPWHAIRRLTYTDMDIS